MHFALAVAIAINFWAARGVTVPCQPVAVPGANAQLGLDADGYPIPSGWAGGCKVLLSDRARFLRADAPDWYCGDVAHEVGHLAGLGHTGTGIMAERLYLDEIPYDCVRWKTYARRHGIPITGRRSGSGSAAAHASGAADPHGHATHRTPS